jgi:hemolysin D
VVDAVAQARPSAAQETDRAGGRASRAFAWTLAAAIAAAIAGACLVEIDVVAVAEGKVIPSARVKRIRPYETGVVRAIRVEDGQPVRAGDILVELDPTIRLAERTRLAHAVRASALDLARLQAMRHPVGLAAARFRPPADADPDEAESHRALLVAELGEHEEMLRELGFDIRRAEAQAEALRAGIAKADAMLPMLRERSSARARLAALGHGARLAHLEIAQQVVDLEHQAIGLRVQLAAGLAQTEALRAARDRRDSDFRRRILSRMIEAERQLLAAREDLRKAEQNLRNQTLTAPIDGTVQQLAANTVGGVAAAGEVLMIVVPDGDPLEIEAMVRNRDIGFVRAGQRAVLKFETFPYTLYGTMEGVVRDVARDALDDGGGGAVYAVRVRPAADRMRIAGRAIALTPGMKATVDILTERRRPIDFVLSPLMRVAQESLRER